MADIDRTYNGAVREIYRLCDVVKRVQQDNKMLQELWESTIKERNRLQWENDVLRNQVGIDKKA